MWHLMGLGTRRATDGSNAKGSRGLREHARWEYGVDWNFALQQALLGARNGQSADSAEGGGHAREALRSMGWDDEACRHARADHLGSGGDTVFRLCVECGAVLLSRDGRQWALRGLLRDEQCPEPSVRLA